MKWLPDVFGVAGYGMTVLGIYDLFGGGVALIVAGAPLVVGYALRETGILRRGG